MGWFKGIVRSIVKKKASKEDLINRALNRIQQKYNPKDIAIEFIGDMGREDPSFTGSPSEIEIMQSATSSEDISINYNSLSAALGNFNATAPLVAPEQNIPSTLDQGPSEGDINLEDIPEFGEIEEPEVGTDEAKPVTDVQRIIEEEGDVQDVEESIEEVPEIEQRDEFEGVQLNIRPESIISVDKEDIKYIPQRQFSIPTTYKKPDDNLAKLQKKINKINKSEYSKGNEPLRINFVTPPPDGSPTVNNVPEKYTKEQTNRAGEVLEVDYTDFVIEGEIPNPSGNPVKKNEKGEEYADKEVVYHIIGSVQLLHVEGYKPKIEKFKTQEEATQHTEMMNQKDPTRKYIVGKKMRSIPFEERYPETKGWCFPSIYEGEWRTIVTRYPNSPSRWDKEYERGSPLNCDHCKTKKMGGSARKSIYVAYQIPAKDLFTEKRTAPDGTEIPQQPIKPTALKDLHNYPQVWIGTKCAIGQQSTLKFLQDLENFKEISMSAEKTGRASDSFGGSRGSTKSLVRIIANYLEAGVKERGNWFKRKYNSLAEFKKHYFGKPRQERYDAALKLHEYEKAIEKYPEDYKNYQDEMRLYPFRVEDWIRDGRIGQKPDKPVLPKDPSKSPAPPGPKPLPWGKVSDENLQKAKDIRKWWTDKAEDPTIDYNNTEVDRTTGASGTEMHNRRTVALNGKVNTKTFEHVPGIIRAYENTMRAPERKIEDEDSAHRYNERFNARRIQEQQWAEQRRIREQERVEREQERVEREQQEAEARRVRQQEMEESGVRLTNVAETDQGRPFISEFTYESSKEWRSGRGANHYLRDGERNLYLIFDKYTLNQDNEKVSNFDLEPGQTYYIKGIKGERNTRFAPYSTTIDSPKIVNPGEEQEIIEEPPPVQELPPIEGLRDIAEVTSGEEFTSKFTFSRSSEWTSGRGMNHVFLDENGNKYLIFDKYKRDPTTRDLIREPSFEFTIGQDYYIKGVKGDFNSRYRTTNIDNPEIVDLGNNV
jgi:hypothetical protein